MSKLLVQWKVGKKVLDIVVNRPFEVCFETFNQVFREMRCEHIKFKKLKNIS